MIIFHLFAGEDGDFWLQSPKNKKPNVPRLILPLERSSKTNTLYIKKQVDLRKKQHEGKENFLGIHKFKPFENEKLEDFESYLNFIIQILSKNPIVTEKSFLSDHPIYLLENYFIILMHPVFQNQIQKLDYYTDLFYSYMEKYNEEDLTSLYDLMRG